MKVIMKKPLSMLLAAAALSVSSVTPAFALEYNYSSGDHEGNFYQSTSVTADSVANSSQIVVGSDGTIMSNTTENVHTGPLSSFQLPIGEYPDSWGKETDVAIAQNSIFPNALAPTTQMTNVDAPVQYETGVINSSALPTPNTSSTSGYGTPTIYSPMQNITSDGAIGYVTIPSIGFNEYVYEGTSIESMQKGLGHFSQTSGWEGNVAFAGHNRGTWGIFQNLNALKVGDMITYTTSQGSKNYRVVSIGTVNDTDTSGLVQDGTNKLTFYTCIANTPGVRRMVVAVQV